jgi:antirestriction protein ArdC
MKPLHRASGQQGLELKMRNIYDEVTNNVIAALEKGTAPWVKPWKDNQTGSALPYNAASGRQYNGINILILWAAAEKMGYSANGWMTFNQAKEKGGYVRKGERGTHIVYWQVREVEDKENPGKMKKVPMMRLFTVFNVAQLEGVTPEVPAAAGGLDSVEEFIGRTGAMIVHGGNRAFYNLSSDTVHLPAREQFNTIADYYATTLHELTHWTGNASRLAREFGKRFGDDAYAAEELVAEMGAAFLCASLGIEAKLQHESYIANWLKVLRADNRAVFTAAKHASLAAEFLRARGAEDAAAMRCAA